MTPPLFPQQLLDLHDELIVDLFAGGGGASLGIEMATGRSPDVAVNHDAAAVQLHAANHPQTRHLCSDVFEVDPREVAQGRPIGLLWASPDCTFHSKARGAKPFRSKDTKRRALAWVVTRWAGQVRPRVIMLENVEEFAQWGPLVGPPDAQRPDPRRRGATFRSWVRSLVRLGYEVEHRELRACDYGAPTIRKRLFLIARCDGAPIVWPEPTHGPKRAHPYRTAAECIDWSVPMLSIFATREEARAWGKAHGQPSPVRPLADATMRRVARGVKRFVLDNPRPFIVSLAHGDSQRTGGRVYPLEEPLGTQHGGGNKFAVVAPVIVRNQSGRSQPARSVEDPSGAVLAEGGNAMLAAPFLVPRYGERDGQAPRTRSVEEPTPVIVPTGNGGSLVGAFLARHFTGVEGSPLDRPVPTITTIDHHALVTATLEGPGAGSGSRAAPDREGNHPGHRDRRGLAAPEYERHPATGAPAVGAGLEARLPDGAAVLEGEALPAGSAPTGLDGPARTDPAGHGPESHRRREEEQPPVEPRAGDAEGEHRALHPDGARAEAWVQRGAVGGPGAAREGAEGEGPVVSRDRGDPPGLADHRLPAGEVAAFLSRYNGVGLGQSLAEPLQTVPTKDRFGLVTVTIAGEPYVVADIAMRMLQPRELYNAQGFHPGYVIDHGADGRRLTKTEQVRMVGNSVSPPQAAALVRANVPELRVRDEVAA